MTTVVNNPPSGSGDGGSGMGMVIGIIVVILIVVLLILFGLPALRGGSGGVDTPDVPAGGGDGGEATLNVPDEINVNVNPGQQ